MRAAVVFYRFWIKYIFGFFDLYNINFNNTINDLLRIELNFYYTHIICYGFILLLVLVIA